MNWSDVAKTISQWAPLAASALSSPVGAAVGIGSIIANLFGVENDPKSVADYINNNPKKSEELLKLEISNNIELQKMVLQTLQERNRHEEQISAIEFENTQGARQNTVNVNASPVDNKIKVFLAVGQLLLIVMCVCSYLIFHNGMTQSVTLTIGTLIGSLVNSLGSMVNFYWGTSFQSIQKAENK